MTGMYEESADIYDLLHAFRVEDIGFYVDLARKKGSPALELACGTGRVLIPVARSGIRVTGIDITKSMLKVLGKKLGKESVDVRKNAEIVEGNMKDHQFGKRFRLVYLPYSSFFVMGSEEDQDKCLKNAYDHLERGGTFAMDTFNFDPNWPQRVLLHENTVKTERGLVSKFSMTRREDDRQIMHVQFIYDIVGNGRDLKRIVESFDLRYALPGQMRRMLKNAGFGKIKMYGDFEKGKFTRDSRTMVFIAEKF